MNSQANGDSAAYWQPDQKYLVEVKDVLKRSNMELEQGILLKYKVLRQKQLDKQVSSNCYGDSKLNVLEAEMCENFYQKNDYKMKILGSFWADHIPKHVTAYQGCMNATHGLESVAEKDKAFADCHKHWIRDWKENGSQELEARARMLFAKNLEE